MTTPARTPLNVGRAIGIAVVASSALALGAAVWQTNRHPRTDDATVRANLIALAPEVEGRVTELPVHDNAYVKKGDLLFAIDPRTYQHAVAIAESEQAALEQQIVDQKRHIAAQTSASQAASAEAKHSSTSVKTAGSTVQVVGAGVARAEAAVQSAGAHLELARNDLGRVEPLLGKQFVTVQEVDRARTAVRVAESEEEQAQAAYDQALRQQQESELRRQESEAEALAAAAKVEQSVHTIDTVDTLEAQRLERAARVDEARVNLERTRVVAPFDGYVTNLNISEGAYAHAGTPMFTLVDARVWYVLANYRESTLRDVPVGAAVDVYLMAHPDRRFSGVVESVSYGVSPEDGATANGLPDVTRTLNWVHLAARFPVRIRLLDPDPALVRIGETAVTTIR